MEERVFSCVCCLFPWAQAGWRVLFRTCWVWTDSGDVKCAAENGNVSLSGRFKLELEVWESSVWWWEASAAEGGERFRGKQRREWKKSNHFNFGRGRGLHKGRKNETSRATDGKPAGSSRKGEAINCTKYCWEVIQGIAFVAILLSKPQRVCHCIRPFFPLSKCVLNPYCIPDTLLGPGAIVLKEIKTVCKAG